MIARETGLSQSAVSNILNNSPDFKYSEETRDRVLRVAEKMGYFTHALRKAIKRPLRQFGFVVSNPDTLETTYMSEIMKGLRQAAFMHGFQFLFCEADWKLGDEQQAEAATRKLINLVKSKVLDGLLIDKARFGNEQMQLLQEEGVPFVCINGRIPDHTLDIHKEANWVCIDHAEGGRLATDYLIRKGHRRIGMIHPGISEYPQSFVPACIFQRLVGYEQALKAWGITIDSELVREGSLTDRNLVIQAVDCLVSLADRPTAIFAADDAIAIIAINRLCRLGLRVPEDISVIGYGHWSVSFVADPILTTVDVPWSRMGQLGAETLIKLIGGEDAVERSVVLQPRLWEGESAIAMKPYTGVTKEITDGE